MKIRTVLNYVMIRYSFNPHTGPDLGGFRGSGGALSAIWGPLGHQRAFKSS